MIDLNLRHGQAISAKDRLTNLIEMGIRVCALYIPLIIRAQKKYQTYYFLSKRFGGKVDAYDARTNENLANEKKTERDCLIRDYNFFMDFLFSESQKAGEELDKENPGNNMHLGGWKTIRDQEKMFLRMDVIDREISRSLRRQ